MLWTAFPVLELRSSYSGASFGGPRTCAFATMEVAPAVYVITSTLAGGAGAGFRFALVHIFMFE